MDGRITLFYKAQPLGRGGEHFSIYLPIYLDYVYLYKYICMYVLCIVRMYVCTGYPQNNLQYLIYTFLLNDCCSHFLQFNLMIHSLGGGDWT